MQTDTRNPEAQPGSLHPVVGRLDWNKIFGEAHMNSWPTESISIQNTKPPHETARNLFKDDEREIMVAAKNHGYRIVSPPKAKVVSFVRSSNAPDQRPGATRL
jgi:hypothetical protein